MFIVLSHWNNMSLYSDTLSWANQSFLLLLYVHLTELISHSSYSFMYMPSGEKKQQILIDSIWFDPIEARTDDLPNMITITLPMCFIFIWQHCNNCYILCYSDVYLFHLNIQSNLYKKKSPLEPRKSGFIRPMTS
jgi:hypothetical protein